MHLCSDFCLNGTDGFWSLDQWLLETLGVAFVSLSIRQTFSRKPLIRFLKFYMNLLFKKLGKIFQALSDRFTVWPKSVQNWPDFDQKFVPDS